MGGPDAHFSIEPEQFGLLVNSIRNVEKAPGSVTYEIGEEALRNRKFSRSLFAVKNINRGEFFSNENIRSIRPGDGISPKL